MVWLGCLGKIKAICHSSLEYLTICHCLCYSFAVTLSLLYVEVRLIN